MLLRIRSKTTREFLAEFAGTFILMVSSKPRDAIEGRPAKPWSYLNFAKKNAPVEGAANDQAASETGVLPIQNL